MGFNDGRSKEFAYVEIGENGERTVSDSSGQLVGLSADQTAGAVRSLYAVNSSGVESAGAATAVLMRYRAAVLAAGGVPVQSQLDAIEPALRELLADPSDVLRTIVEIHLPMGADGDLPSALTKLYPGYNNSGVRNYALTNTLVVAGNYTALGGIDPGVGNTTKLLDSDVRISNPLNRFTLTPSVGIGLMCVSLRKHTVGRLLGLTNQNNWYVSDAPTGFFSGSNNVAVTMDAERAILGVEGYVAPSGSNTTDIIASGVATRQSVSSTMVTAVGTSGVRVFGSDVATKSDMIYAGYILYRAPASREQRTAMARFMRKANLALGRAVGGDGVNSRVLRIDGDSITSTSNNSSGNVLPAVNWAQLVANGLGLSRHASQDTLVLGSAVGGRAVVLSATAAGNWGTPDNNAGGRSYQQTMLGRQVELSGTCLGVNDNLNGADPVFFDSTLEKIVADYMATGIDANQYFLCTPPIRNGWSGAGSSLGRNYDTAAPFAASIRRIARKFGIRVVPFYEHDRVAKSASTSWDFDGFGVHPETDIHAVMADLTLEYLSMPASRTW